MGSDGLRELRAALYSADGDAAVAVVRAHGLTGCLQLVGDVLVLAVDRQAAGADELATAFVEALRARRWDGDAELSDALDAARGAVTPTTHLIEIAVDLEQLADLRCPGGP